MLGVTVADSVLVGTLILAVLAAWQGKKDGASAAKAAPQVDVTRELVAVLKDLVEVAREALDARESQSQLDTAEVLKHLSAKIDRLR